MTDRLLSRSALATGLAALVLPTMAACGGSEVRGVAAPAGTATATASASASAAGTQPSTEGSGAPEEPQKTPGTPSPAVTTPVAAPSAGSIDSVVPTQEVSSVPEAPIAGEARLKDKVRVRITTVQAIEAKATIPGDVAGPAVQFDVVVSNGTDQPVPAGNAVVNVSGRDKSPAVMLVGAPTSPFKGDVGARKTATATYAFRVPKDQRVPIRIEVSIDPSLPVAHFTGNVK